ncbi:MAG: helix-turn-helix transcriptional regulator [Clostridia bacterium]|jgi:transcriptional regulator with XRE-family HTH domain|nr:helix-turn-helix transcriptional regulator [Clostridia bacterium]
MSDSIVGNTIRNLRKSKKMSQEQLGKILGYSARTVSDWENGSTEPNISAIKGIVSFFEISYDEFFDD